MFVSVVMSCKNSNCNLLFRAIRSVLCQTFTEFELIIVDDGSKYSIKQLLSGIEDSRLKVYRLDNSSGLGDALNFGVSKSIGSYIVRLDDDDIMKPDRIRKQFEFLELNRNVVCVGTQLELLYSNKSISYRKFPVINDLILFDLVRLKFSLAHTTVMFRKEAFELAGGYRVRGGGQDLDLFLQLSYFGQLANLDEYLTCYSLSMSGLSVTNSKKNEAYRFALNDIRYSDRFQPYAEEISKTLNYLIKNRLKKEFNWKRLVLIMYVIIFGKSIREII
jgi:glycosyltransferase involved in cell wall biosynthesis